MSTSIVLATSTQSQRPNPRIEVRGTHFVMCSVADMERSLRFYRDFLGMGVGANWGTSGWS